MVLQALWVEYKNTFFKVWEYKDKHQVKNRRASADYTGVINTIPWDFPKLCETWWHGSRRLANAFWYTENGWDWEYLYYWKMECKSVVDYWTDKVSCLSCSFTEPEKVKTSLVKEVSQGESILEQRLNSVGKSWAKYLSVWFRADFPDRLTWKEAALIVELLKLEQQDNKKYALHLLKDNEKISTVPPERMYIYSKEHFKERLYNYFTPKKTDKIMEHLEYNYDILSVLPFRDML